MKTAVRSLLLLTTLLLVGCSALNTVDFGDLDPINPDPNDPLDELLYEGYVLYTNVDNTIVKLDPADPTASELVISNVDADTPTFYITEDDDGDTCAVFGRSTDADGNAGPFVAIKNMDTGDEVILTDSYASHGVDREFIVVGGDVIYSSNGNLKSFNIATGDPAVGGDAIISNASSYVCSHFPQYFADGVITFAEHVPGEIAGTLHMVKYEPPTAQPVDFLKSIYY